MAAKTVVCMGVHVYCRSSDTFVGQPCKPRWRRIDRKDIFTDSRRIRISSMIKRSCLWDETCNVESVWLFVCFIFYISDLLTFVLDLLHWPFSSQCDLIIWHSCHRHLRLTELHSDLLFDTVTKLCLLQFALEFNPVFMASFCLVYTCWNLFADLFCVAVNN